MADKNPTPTQVVNEEISPDGNVIKTSAAPVRQTPSRTAEKPKVSMEDLEKVPDGQEYQAPVKEEDNESIDFNQFLDAAGKDKVPEPEKKEEKSKLKTTPEDDVVPVEKTEDKKEPDVKAVKPEDKKVTDKPDGRDYTGIDETDVAHFKRMSNESFAALKPIYTAHKQLKQDFSKTQEELKTLKEKGPQLPETYYEHPQAFLLNPEFQTSVADLQWTQRVLAHWQEQYEKVASGAAEFDFLDTDPTTGQLKITGKIPANRGSEAKLLTYINHAQSQVTRAMAGVQTFQQLHTQKHGEAVKGINEQRAKYFSGLYNTPENKAIYEPLVKQHIDSLPASFKYNPLASAYAESLVMNQILAQLLNQAKAEKGNGAPVEKQITTEEAEKIRKGNPRTSEITGDGAVRNGKTKDEDVSIDDYEAAKRGY